MRCAAGVVWLWLGACTLDESVPRVSCVVDADCLANRSCVDERCQDRSETLPETGGEAGASAAGTGTAGNDGGAGDRSGTPTSQGGAGGPGAGGPGASGPGASDGGGGGAEAGASGSPPDANAGASGSHSDESSSGAGGQIACPEAPGSVKLPAGFCIDSHEVTRGDYDAWRALTPAIGTAAGCEHNTLEPSCIWVTGTDHLPANCVDWCDASAYCGARGARLCGAIGGGSSSFTQPNEPESQWFNACSSAGRFGYPYGDDYDADACNTEDVGIADVGAHPACRAPAGPYACVFDLSGNVREWEDACDGDAVTSRCRIRGGAYPLDGDDVACTAVASYSRSTSSELIGFRCCSDSCD